MSEQVLTNPPESSPKSITKYCSKISKGIEPLANAKSLTIKQIRDLIEVLIGFEAKNKYEISDEQGNRMYYAVEQNSCLTRQCCPAERPFDMHFFDLQGNKIFNFERPLRCNCCLFPCCLQTINVIYCRSGESIGYVSQNWSLFYPRFSVYNNIDQIIYRIQGPCFTCCKANFIIQTINDNIEIGRIAKQWGGVLKEFFTDEDSFAIEFPSDSDVNRKALLMAAAFLIDFMYYENNDKENRKAFCSYC